MPPRRQLLTLAAGLLAPTARAAPTPRLIRLPYHEQYEDPQRMYVARVIELAMRHAGVPARVEHVNMEIAQRRSLAELARGASPFDLLWTMTDRQRETSGLLPVRIPIDRGLMGWRVPVVRRAELPRWHGLGSLPALSTFTAGQGMDWPDTAILRANGLKVETSTGPDTLYRMLLNGRFDYFPRSVLEVDIELGARREAPLALVPDLLLRYPAAAYLFVAPQQNELAEQLERGLNAAIRDGSFQRLHAQHYLPTIRKYLTPQLRVIELQNPLLPPQTPLGRKELWMAYDANLPRP